MLKKIIAATALVSFASAPVMAEASSERPVASVERATAPAERESELGGPGLIIGLLALAAIIAGVIIAADGDDPVSA